MVKMTKVRTRKRLHGDLEIENILESLSMVVVVDGGSNAGCWEYSSSRHCTNKFFFFPLNFWIGIKESIGFP